VRPRADESHSSINLLLHNGQLSPYFSTFPGEHQEILENAEQIDLRGVSHCGRSFPIAGRNSLIKSFCMVVELEVS
jgi:hypothetical protein